MKNHHSSWENELQIVIFHSYLKLPGGNMCLIINTWVNQDHPNQSTGESTKGLYLRELSLH